MAISDNTNSGAGGPAADGSAIAAEPPEDLDLEDAEAENVKGGEGGARGRRDHGLGRRGAAGTPGRAGSQ